MSDKIIQTVCRKWRVLYSDVVGNCRKQPLPLIRMTIAHLLRQYTALSLMQIGCLLHRDHSTVSHYLKAYESEFRFNKDFRNFAKSIREELDDIPKDPFALEIEEEFNEIYG